MLKFKKKDDLIHLEVNGTSLTTSYETADTFSKHVQSVHSITAHRFLYSVTRFMNVLSLASISGS